MSLRFTDADLTAFRARAADWESRGVVRTHVIADDEGRIVKKPAVAHRKAELRQLKLTERQVLRACLNALQVHPKVAFAWRQNVGGVVIKARTIRFAFRGCADPLGCLKGGRWLAVECKATGKKPTADQLAFLGRVNASGGLGIVVDDAAQLVRALEAA